MKYIYFIPQNIADYNLAIKAAMSYNVEIETYGSSGKGHMLILSTDGRTIYQVPAGSESAKSWRNRGDAKRTNTLSLFCQYIDERNKPVCYIYECRTMLTLARIYETACTLGAEVRDGGEDFPRIVIYDATSNTLRSSSISSIDHMTHARIAEKVFSAIDLMSKIPSIPKELSEHDRQTCHAMLDQIDQGDFTVDDVIQKWRFHMFGEPHSSRKHSAFSKMIEEIGEAHSASAEAKREEFADAYITFIGWLTEHRLDLSTVQDAAKEKMRIVIDRKQDLHRNHSVKEETADA